MAQAKFSVSSDCKGKAAAPPSGTGSPSIWAATLFPEYVDTASADIPAWASEDIIMVIRKAVLNDLEQIEQTYDEHFEHEKTHGAFTIFEKGVYPTREVAERAIREGAMHVCVLDGEIAGSIIANATQPAEYTQIPWDTDGRALVLHLLLVRPSMAGRGIGTALVEYAMQLARQSGYAALRLDTGSQNTPAVSLYKKNGFRIVSSGTMAVGGVLTHMSHLFLEKLVQ